MSSYIDADALLFELSGKDPQTHIPSYMLEYCGLMCKILKEYPKSDVAPVVHAHWIVELADNGWKNTTCSNCGLTINDDIHISWNTNYCPDCGAKMDEEVDE